MNERKIIGMIPTWMGSRRLKQKNLREIDGVPIKRDNKK
jgi:CMP-N-acetylneuraminic acid synthetase